MSTQVALVTGGSTGIGAAIAEHLAKDGYRVIITGRNEDTLKTSAGQHENIQYFMADVARLEDIEATVDYVRKEFDRLDVLVNNAGIAEPVPFTEITPEQFDKTFNINVRGLLFMTQKVLPLLQKCQGTIINITSIVGDQPFAGFQVYSASKGAVITLTKGLAKELAGDGIRVNAVSPGPIETPLFDKMGFDDKQKEHVTGSIADMVPLGRFGTADEVAAVVSFLASDAASYITGVQYKVDGGVAA